MRKLIVIFAMMSLMVGMVVLAAPESVQAQTYVKKVRDRNGRVRWVRVRKPSYYRRHRNRINMAVGTGAGALVGGLIGGGRGALVGGGLGLGASALYTYKIRPKKRKYRKIRRY